MTYEDNARHCLRLTEDGEIAGILSSLKPEAVRMVLWANANAPIHRKRVLKMASLLSLDDGIFFGPRRIQTELSTSRGFTKRPTSQTSVQLKLVKDEAEEYEHEKEHSIHQLGDHFLMLREFESFEIECNRTLKSASNSKLHLWCKKRGLNYAALNQAQLLSKRYHTEMKKRKILVDQQECAVIGSSDKTTCNWTSDEAIIRSMIAGYFHKLVVSSDPLLKNKYSAFTLLSSGKDNILKVRLDQDSCLWKLVNTTNKKRETLDFIPDDDEEVHADDIRTDKQILFSLLLFTRLQSFAIRSSQEEMILMQGATVVDTNWIREQASKSWLERIDLDELDSNAICGMIRNIGPRVLHGLLRFIEELKMKTDASSIDICKDSGEVLIYGNQAAVMRSKETILTQVEALIKNYYIQDEKSVHVHPIGSFGSGLELQHCINSKQYKVQRMATKTASRPDFACNLPL